MEENLRSIYDKLVSSGSQGSYEDFVSFFNENDQNKKNVYDKLMTLGSHGTYDEFLAFAGGNTQPQPAPQRVDVSDVEAAQQPQAPAIESPENGTEQAGIPTVTMEQLDNAGHYQPRTGGEPLKTPEQLEAEAQQAEPYREKPQPLTPPEIPVDTEIKDDDIRKSREKLGLSNDWGAAPFGRDKDGRPIQWNPQGRPDIVTQHEDGTREYNFSPESVSEMNNLGKYIAYQSQELAPEIAEVARMKATDPNYKVPAELKAKIDEINQATKFYDEYEKAYKQSPFHEINEQIALKESDERLAELKGRQIASWSGAFAKTVGAGIALQASQEVAPSPLDYVFGKKFHDDMEKQSEEMRRQGEEQLGKASLLMMTAQELEQAKNTIRLSQRNQGGAGYYPYQLWNGVIYSNLTGLDQISSMSGALGLAKIAEKLDEKGQPKEPLTEEEQMAYDALVFNSAVQQRFGGNITMLNRVGQSIPENTAYVLDFFIGSHMGAQAFGKGAAGMAKKGINMAVKKQVKNGALRFTLDKALPTLAEMGAKTTYRTMLDMPFVYADATRRSVGTMAVDPETMQAYGFMGGKDDSAALSDAWWARFIDNGSEALGDMVFEPGAGMVWRGIKDTKGGVKLQQARKWFGDLGNGRIDDALTTARRFNEQHGTGVQFGWETAEEFAGGTANALFVGDQELKEVYSSENMMETALNCFIFGVAQASTITGMKRVFVDLPNDAKIRGAKREAAAVINDMDGISVDDIERHIDEDSSNGLADWLYGMNNEGDWNEQQRKAVMAYTQARIMEKAKHQMRQTKMREDIEKSDADVDASVNNVSGNVILASFELDGQKYQGTVIKGRVSTMEEPMDDGNGNVSVSYKYNPYLSSATLGVRLKDGTVKVVGSKAITSIDAIEEPEALKEQRRNSIMGEVEQEITKATTTPSISQLMGGFDFTQTGGTLSIQGQAYRYDGRDDNGNYTFTPLDEKGMADENRKTTISEKSMRTMALLERLNAALATNASEEEVDDIMDELATEQELDNIEKSKDEANIWAEVAQFLGGHVTLNDEGDFDPEKSDVAGAAGYLVSLKQGDINAAAAIVDERINELTTRLMERPEGVQNNGEGVVGMAVNGNAADGIAAQSAEAITFLKKVREAIAGMQQEKAVIDAAKPVSQMQKDDIFPVEVDGQRYWAQLDGHTVDGPVVSLYDNERAEGEPVDAAIDDMTDEQWEAVRVQPVNETYGTDGTDSQEPPMESAGNGTEQVQPEPQPQPEPTPTPNAPTPTPNPEPAPQQEQPQAEYPKDKQGKPQYDMIDDPNVFLQALVDEWGEDALGALDDIIEDTKEGLEQKSKLEQRRINKRLAMLEAVRGMMQPQEEISGNQGDISPNPTVEDGTDRTETTDETPAAPVEETPQEEAPKEEAPAETPMESAGEGTEPTVQQPTAETTPPTETVQEPPVEQPQAETPTMEVPTQPVAPQKPKPTDPWTRARQQIGEPTSAYEAILLDIMNGTKFKWGVPKGGGYKKDKDTGKRVWVDADLGIGDLWGYKPGERDKRKGMLDDNGYTVETYAEALQQGKMNDAPWFDNMDLRDIRDLVEEALQYTTGAKSAKEQLLDARQKRIEEEQRQIRTIQDAEAKALGFDDADDMEAYYNSLKENVLSDEEYEELNRIFAEQIQEEDGQRTGQGESEADSREPEPNEREGVPGEGERGTGLLQTEQTPDTETAERPRQGEGGEAGGAVLNTPQEPSGAAEVRDEIDKLKAQRANLAKQRDDLQKRYEQANGLFGDMGVGENSIQFEEGQNFLAPDLAQTTIDGYNNKIKKIDEEIKRLEASLERAKEVTQTEIGGENKTDRTDETDKKPTKPESREELDKRLKEERKQRILKEGTSFDQPFGLVPVSETMTTEDIETNVGRIVQGLKDNEGSGNLDQFYGYAYQGAFGVNAGEQVKDYIDSLYGVVPMETLKAWYDSIGLKTYGDLVKYGKELYDNTQKTEQNPVPQPEPKEEKKPEKLASKKIEDVGEKIEGARKDLAKKLSTKIDLEAETFPKMFPKFDLKKLVGQGLDPKLASAVMFLRQAAYSDYKRDLKHKRKEHALGGSRFMAAYAKHILENADTDVEFTDNRWVFTDYGKIFVKTNIALYEKIHEKMGDDMFGVDLSDYKIDPINTDGKLNYTAFRRNENGEEERFTPYYQARAKSGTFYFKEDELDKAIDLVLGKIERGVSYEKSHPFKLNVYYTRGTSNQFYVGVKIGNEVEKLTENFSTSNEALAYLNEHNAELQEKSARLSEQRKEEKKQEKPVAKVEIIQADKSKGYSGGYVFAVKLGKEYVRIMEDVYALPAIYRYEKEHRDELQQMAQQKLDQYLEDVEKGKGWKPQLNLGGGRTRVGEDYRQGRDVSGDEFREAFGFRGVQFGNYVTQKERQRFLNEAYDALMDLADLIGVSPKALSLGGQLGFAIGARGGGGSNAAHYEPGENVINLTKTQGAGSLAHEWWHALDYYFNREGENRRKSATAVTEAGDFSEGVRNEMRDAFLGLMERINNSDYFTRSKALERRLHPSSVGTGYYDKPTELGARAFQDYVSRRLTERGQVNDFLSSFTPEEQWNGEAKTYPYPTGEDATAIDERFDKLFGTMEERQDEQGNAILYHKVGEEVVRDEKEIELMQGLVEWEKSFLGEDSVITDSEEAQRVLDEANGKIREQRVYHNSPHLVKKADGSYVDKETGERLGFDHRFMGTGEGAQVHGWGSYFSIDDLRHYGYGGQRAEVFYKGEKFNVDEVGDDLTANGKDAALKFIVGHHAGDFGVYDTAEKAINAIDKYIEADEIRLQKKDYPLRYILLKDYYELIAARDYLEENGYKDIVVKPNAHHYDVDIPENNGVNYFEENEPLKPEQIKALKEQSDKEGKQSEIGAFLWYANPEKNPYADKYTFAKFLSDITSHMGGGLTRRQASEFFSRAGFTGIHYIGQRDGEGYVIFNENDAKITEHIRFFRTPSGEAYGFTVGGKVYIDPRIATAETPIHEYAHLYGEAIRRANPEAWEHLKQDLLGHKDVMDYVKSLYPKLEGDELMDEVWAHFSGKRGADYMRAEQKRMMDEAEGYEGVSRVAAIFDRIRKALKKFWNMARDLFAGNNEKLKDMKAEDFADMMMNDFANKFDPRTVKGKEGAKPQSDEVKYSMIGRQGAQRLDLKERAMTRLNNLHTAREMEQQGKDAKAIRLATGWERGKDGKWRFEIGEASLEGVVRKLAKPLNDTRKAFYEADAESSKLFHDAQILDDRIPKRLDSRFTEEEKEKYRQMRKKRDEMIDKAYERIADRNDLDDKIKNGTFELRLGDIIPEDDELLIAYPQLKDTKIEYQLKPTIEGGAEGLYDDKTNTIKLAVQKNASEVYSTLYHEIQHAIQGIEGFAQGGNLSTAIKDKEVRELLEKELNAKIDELKKREKAESKDYSLDIEDAEFALEQLKENKLPVSVAFEYYKRIAGEVEARNVQKRLGLTAEQRREALLADTEDVAREDQIVLMEGSEAMSVAEGEEPSVEPVSEEELNNYDAGRMTFTEIATEGVIKAAEKNKDDLRMRNEAVKAIGVSLNRLRQAMAKQKEYDKATVDSIVRLARMMIENGYMDNMSRSEVKRLMALAKNATGRTDITKQANAVVDLMLKHQLKAAEAVQQKLLSTKGSKVNASGVEVQAGLDITGQRTIKAMKEGIELNEAALDERIADVNDRMGGTDKTLAANAAEEYEGLMMAKDYHDMIRQSEQDEAQLRHELDQAKEDLKNGTLGRKEYKELAARIDAALRKNMAERVTAFTRLNQQLAEVINGSKGRAREFREKQMERVREIQHNANSDMKGTPASEHKKAARINKVVNSGIVRFLFKPVATFDEMLRFFGKKSVDGMGYLWQRFMGGYIDAADTEWRSLKKDHDALDEKVSEVMGEKMRWSDLFSMERKMDPIEVEFYDLTTDEEGNSVRVKEKHQLTQGNALYIYMVNKMDDGAMKLRRMGITDEDVDQIVSQLDKRFVQLADWIQDEFLPKKREAFNAVHMRMFGAPMAAIEEYFPLVTNSRSRGKDEDISEHDKGETKPSTITGSIIKRKVNTTPLDVTNADAFDVLLGHLRDMEHWAAFAELNRDMNTLLSYKRFKNQVLNTSSVRFGAGETLWNNFKDVCAIAADVYHPKVNRQSLDNAIVNISKGVTSAKISFRLYTALKQLLSYPAYFSEANPIELAKSTGRPAKAFNWALDNLPGFAERWQSRQAGDSRLKDTDADWDFWKNKFVDTARRWGMTPNAFVDGITVAMGAKAIYESKMKGYLKAGYSEAEAKEKALKEASAAVNETQQSSQNAYLSAMQLDRTVASVALTVFRNASMGYERRMLRAVDNIKRKFTKGYKEESIEFMRKKMVREGLTEEQAKAASERAWNISIAKDVANVVIFGFVMQLAWNLGSNLMYLVFGDDDDEKEKMWEDAALHALSGPVEGLSGGSVISEVYNMARSGKKISNYNFQLLPIMSDLQTTMRHMEQDKVRGIQDIVNLVIQAGVGVNPQTITDAAVAIVDAADGDLGVGKEIGMLLLRIAQVPQSQLDQLYIDELGMSAKDAKALPMEELAQRYAAYKRMKDAPLTGWAYSDEAKEKVDKRYVNRFVKLVQERVANMDDEALERNMDDNDDPMLKKQVGKEVASRLEGKDTYGNNPQSNWKEETKKAHLAYQQLRGYVDLCEDVVLQKAQADADKAYEAALEEGKWTEAQTQQMRAKGIEQAREQLNKMRRQLGQGNGQYDQQIMEGIRQARHLYMEYYGLVGRKE